MFSQTFLFPSSLEIHYINGPFLRGEFHWSLFRESPEPEKKEEGENKTDDSKAESSKKVWSQAHFAAEYRRFNIDMTPKVSLTYYSASYLSPS